MGITSKDSASQTDAPIKVRRRGYKHKSYETTQLLENEVAAGNLTKRRCLTDLAHAFMKGEYHLPAQNIQIAINALPELESDAAHQALYQLFICSHGRTTICSEPSFLKPLLAYFADPTIFVPLLALTPAQIQLRFNRLHRFGEILELNPRIATIPIEAMSESNFRKRMNHPDALQPEDGKIYGSPKHLEAFLSASDADYPELMQKLRPLKAVPRFPRK